MFATVGTLSGFSTGGINFSGGANVTAPSALALTLGATASDMYQELQCHPFITSTTGASSQLDGVCIGTAPSAPADAVNGKVAEMVVCNSVLSPTDLGLLFTYLGTRYGKAWS